MKKIFALFLSVFVLLLCASCATKMIPAEDIEVFTYCNEEITILKNPRLGANSKEKYFAALSLSNKIDFSYTRTVGFLDKIFSEQDARMNRIDNDLYAIVVYYQYKDKFIRFEFKRVNDDIIVANVVRN